MRLKWVHPHAFIGISLLLRCNVITFQSIVMVSDHDSIKAIKHYRGYILSPVTDKDIYYSNSSKSGVISSIFKQAIHRFS